MNVFFVIYEYKRGEMRFNIKIIRRVIPSTIDQIDKVFNQNMDLIRDFDNPCQMDIILRPDNAVFEYWKNDE